MSKFIVLAYFFLPNHLFKEIYIFFPLRKEICHLLKHCLCSSKYLFYEKITARAKTDISCYKDLELNLKYGS